MESFPRKHREQTVAVIAVVVILTVIAVIVVLIAVVMTVIMVLKAKMQKCFEQSTSTKYEFESTFDGGTQPCIHVLPCTCVILYF